MWKWRSSESTEMLIMREVGRWRDLALFFFFLTRRLTHSLRLLFSGTRVIVSHSNLSHPSHPTVPPLHRTTLYPTPLLHLLFPPLFIPLHPPLFTPLHSTPPQSPPLLSLVHSPFHPTHPTPPHSTPPPPLHSNPTIQPNPLDHKKMHRLQYHIPY